MSTPIYRRIYEQHYGQIPQGYHIHHKDGNHYNNNIDNLVALSPQDHYNIHREQQDYGACWAMVRTGHLKVSHEERSFLTSKYNMDRLNSGTHFFLSDEHKIQQSIRMRQLSDQGLHPWQKDNYHKRLNCERIEKGNHNWIGSSSNKSMLEKGLHPSQKEWTCEICGKSGKGSTNYKRWHGINCRIGVKN